MAKRLAIRTGTIHLEEISGACWIPDPEPRLILVSDEHGIFEIADPVTQLLAGSVRALNRIVPTNDDRINDLEDVVWDGEHRLLYFLGSHSRSRRGGEGKKRRVLLRMAWGPDGVPGEDAVSGSLQTALNDQAPSLLQAQERTAAQAGLNMEGLEWFPGPDGGELLVGLRSPTLTAAKERPDRLQEDAILLRLSGATGLFGPDAGLAQLRPAPERPDDEYVGRELGRLWSLNLGGMGIRGLAADPDHSRTWILAGLATDPNHDIGAPPWEVFREGSDGSLKRIALPTRGNLQFPEAICRLDLDGEPYLLLVEDTPGTSGYLLLPCDILG